MSSDCIEVQDEDIEEIIEIEELSIEDCYQVIARERRLPDVRVADIFGDYEGNEFARSVSERVIMIAEKG